jgi:chromosome partitioning protein
MIIAVANQKGGVGKSTTAHAMGAALKGKTLFIDLDAQGNLTYALGGKASTATMDMLIGRQTAKAAIQQTPGGDLIPSSPSMSGADLTLTMTGKEYRLKEAIEPIRASYDWIVIDTPPSLGVLTVNALTASDWLVITAQADIYSLQGIGQLRNTVDAVRQYCNKDLIIKGILLTRYSRRSILSKDMAAMMEETAKQLGTKLFSTKIRENIALKEAQARQQDIFTYSRKSNGGMDYMKFVIELTREVRQ